MRLQILVPVQTYPEGNTDAVTPYAAAIGRHLNAEVHALVQVVEFRHLSSALGNLLIDLPAMIADAKAKCRARGTEFVGALHKQAEPIGVSVRVTEVECSPEAFGDAVAGHARYHDFVVMGLGAENSAHEGTVEAVIFGSGRPTLLIPERASAESFERIMIAWDGSRAAARAVSDARDFLKRAQTVAIVSVTDEKPMPKLKPADRLADYFSRREIQATVEEVRGDGRPVGQVLQEHAREIGADMIIMGAFGHSRIRDFVLGGATRGILKDLQIPTLLSH